MELKLSQSIIELKESIKYGEKCDIEAIFLKGVKGVGGEFDTSVMWNAKIQTLKTYIISITEEGKEVKFTEEWLRNLSVEDGDNLVKTIDNLHTKKKEA